MNHLKRVDANDVESAIENAIGWRDHTQAFDVNCEEMRHFPNFNGEPTLRLVIVITQRPKPDEAPADPVDDPHEAAVQKAFEEPTPAPRPTPEAVTVDDPDLQF